jgi:phage FluMu protein gp41
MAGITLLQAQTQLDSYLAAETAVLSGQSYEIAGRKLSRADLASIQQGVQLWNSRVINLTNQSRGRSRARTVVASA